MEYQLPYIHRVQVGVRAGTDQAGIDKAMALFDAGRIWDDSDDVPLLFDDYEEDGDAGVPLEFKVVAALHDEEDWPDADASVCVLRRQRAAMKSARMLVEAYRRGEAEGGSIDWADIDAAYSEALKTI
ncbi:hypothetical protein B1C78_00535 [Thioalkalivibrio denitrificans]|uniref:Uncharacterized protein n=1 Tax=Thioalkalivibrio denitrificans TaxID=108003 RepID=A0A1V3NUQ9_9GAMM|nr:hypothetical protein B1C78_00535 [Thioalkalivibrio denitrificans]